MHRPESRCDVSKANGWQDHCRCSRCRAPSPPTCSAKHVPGYVQHFDDSKAAPASDEIWCVSVNDAFVMGAWARDQKTGAKVRMLADGSADFAKATGLTLDLTGRGMGLRSNRYSMLVKDGKVATLNVEAPGKFEVSNAETLLAQARAERQAHDQSGPLLADRVPPTGPAFR